jgi:ribose transport system ATP-binding protein
VSATHPLIRVRDIRKQYGGVAALRGVDIDIYAGEVHGLVGANGAGKSTLIKILAGLEWPDNGHLVIDDRPVQLREPLAATRFGLGFIHQELNLVPHLTALENIVLGVRKPTRFGMIAWDRVRATVEPLAQRLRIAFPLSRAVKDLTVGEQWMVSICRALTTQVRLLVLDEPTASLSDQESNRLFRVIKSLRNDGVAVLYVSHRLEEIMDLCDRVTVFRDGQRVLTVRRTGLERSQLTEAIVGGALSYPVVAPIVHSRRETPVLIISGLTRLPRVRDVSFQIHQGEVLGIAGLVGAGRTELAQLIFGIDQPSAGTMILDGRPFQPRSPAEAVNAGIGLVPEERRSEGLFLRKSVTFNLGVTTTESSTLSPWLPLLRMWQRAKNAAASVEKLGIKTAGIDRPVERLSGGNQQKVVVGKWLARRLRLLILDEPSRGVDVGARSEIHRLIRDVAAQGTAVLVISSDAEELPELCDRVLVMVEGTVREELTGSAITRELLVHASYRQAAVEESV